MFAMTGLMKCILLLVAAYAIALPLQDNENIPMTVMGYSATRSEKRKIGQDFLMGNETGNYQKKSFQKRGSGLRKDRGKRDEEESMPVVFPSRLNPPPVIIILPATTTMRKPVDKYDWEAQRMKFLRLETSTVIELPNCFPKVINRPESAVNKLNPIVQSCCGANVEPADPDPHPSHENWKSAKSVGSVYSYKWEKKRKRDDPWKSQDPRSVKIVRLKAKSGNKDIPTSLYRCWKNYLSRENK